MALPYCEAVLDAARVAKASLREEGEEPTVMLLHPTLARKVYAECGHDPKYDTPEDVDPAPMMSMLRVIEDDSVDEDEVCVLSDERYMEHIRLKLEDELGESPQEEE